MAYFADTEALYKCLGTLFDRVAQDGEIGPKLGAAGMVIRFVYTEPDAQITVDTKSKVEKEGFHFTNTYGPCDLVPDVLMTMKGDVGHTFWLGKVNLINALTRRQIVAEGPIPKILKLLPIIKPTYKLYPEILKELGLANLII
ncbi:MAG: hypothetical protein HY815_05425 [Candidatus Riflebacteria bacterium]|nr:hypothetical protein [Candidatus Riflebacteria bacterium]